MTLPDVIYWDYFANFECHIGATHESKKSAWELYNSVWGYLWEKKDDKSE